MKRLLDEMEADMQTETDDGATWKDEPETTLSRFVGEGRFEPAHWPDGWYDVYGDVDHRMERWGFEQTPSIVVCRYSEEPFFFHRRISGEGDTWVEVDKRGSVTLLPTEAEMADLMQHHDIGHTRFGFDDTKDMYEVRVTDAMGRRVGTEVKVAVVYTVECPDGQMVGDGARLHVGDRITDEFSLTPQGRAHLTAFCISAGVDLPCGDDEASMAQWARAIVHARVGVLRALSAEGATVVGFVRSCVPADAPFPVTDKEATEGGPAPSIEQLPSGGQLRAEPASHRTATGGVPPITFDRDNRLARAWIEAILRGRQVPPGTNEYVIDWGELPDAYEIDWFAVATEELDLLYDLLEEAKDEAAAEFADDWANYYASLCDAE